MTYEELINPESENYNATYDENSADYNSAAIPGSQDFNENAWLTHTPGTQMRPENYGQSDVDFAAVDALFESGDPEAAGELMASLWAENREEMAGLVAASAGYDATGFDTVADLAYAGEDTTDFGAVATAAEAILFGGADQAELDDFTGALDGADIDFTEYDVNVDQVKGTAANLLAAKDELIGDVGDVGDELAAEAVKLAISDPKKVAELTDQAVKTGKQAAKDIKGATTKVVGADTLKELANIQGITNTDMTNATLDTVATAGGSVQGATIKAGISAAVVAGDAVAEITSSTPTGTDVENAIDKLEEPLRSYAKSNAPTIIKKMQTANGKQNQLLPLKKQKLNLQRAFLMKIKRQSPLERKKLIINSILAQTNWRLIKL